MFFICIFAEKMRNVLVVDCHDSFVYNLVQIIRESELCSFDVVPVDEIDYQSLSRYTHILLSPGPGLPHEYPQLFSLIEKTKSTHAILGICLGLQAIVEHFGGKLKQLSHPVHGHENCLVFEDPNEALFESISSPCKIGHYHSWIADADSIVSPLHITARDDDGLVMAISHESFSIRAVQFHPESIMTDQGARMITNWLLMSEHRPQATI